MKRIAKSLIANLPFIKNLKQQIKKQGAFSAGHYYSPIPAAEDVLAYIKSMKSPSSEIPGIELNVKTQQELLDEYINFYKDLPFKEKPSSDHRYYYANDWFTYSDAIFLYCFLRKHKPKRIIEIGSGFSSAVMLDTIEYLDLNTKRPEVTFIEPYPDRLVDLLKDGDIEHVNLISKSVQEISHEIFFALESGDLLFIDSSHVVKCGSDLQILMFDILPRLQPGVFVHFHDVFYPFEYPSEWLTKGWYWNENYFLRAFLSYNSEWSIQFYNTYVHFMFAELIAEKMPLCAKNTGGSLYIQRNQKS